MRSTHLMTGLVFLLGSGCTQGASNSPGALETSGETGNASADATDAVADADDAGSDHGDDAADSTGSPDTPPGDLFLDGFFPIGVFGQPVANLESWSDRGCNAMFEVPQGESASAWDQEAQRLGLRTIRPPIGSPSADIGRTDLLAWSMPDEPDIDANNAVCGGNCVELCEYLAQEWHAADPDRKIFVNLAGPNVLLESGCDYCNGPGDEPPAAGCFPNNDQCYPRIIETADWISQDIYPVTGWLPSESLRADVMVPGKTLEKLRGWTDKPLFAIIELSDQRLGFEGTGTRAPTAGEYRAEVWGAIIHGARGIFYFPQAFNPFEWDATPGDVLAELELQHETITSLADVLQGEIDPPGVTVAADAPLEYTWRRSGSTTYVFVLNPTAGSGSGATITVQGVDAGPMATVHNEARDIPVAGGILKDNFDAYAIHVYVVPST